MTTPYPVLPEFDYLKPNSIKEASNFLAENSDTAVPFLGGTDIFVQLRDRVIEKRFLVDVKTLNGMNEISIHHDQGVTIGAAVNMNQVVRSPIINSQYEILTEACRSVASYQLRNRATIIGNICNASPAGDTLGASLLLGGTLVTHGITGWGEIPLKDFFLAPGKTTLSPGEIVTAIRFPTPKSKIIGKYIKLGRNKKSDLAIVGVTAIGYQNDQAISGFSIKLALASVGPTPLVISKVEELFSQSKISHQSISEAAIIAMDSCNPIDDVRGSARYRKAMVRNLSQIAITDVCGRLGIISQ